MAIGSMNRSMNLPQLQRIAMEFERENDIMDQRQEMMDDAIDDAMDTGVEEEGDEVVEQVLEEIGVDLSQSVSPNPTLTVATDRVQLMKRPFSLARHLRAYKHQLWPRARWLRLKQSAAVVVEEEIPAMMTFRHDWTALGDNVPAEVYTVPGVAWLPGHQVLRRIPRRGDSCATELGGGVIGEQVYSLQFQVDKQRSSGPKIS